MVFNSSRNYYCFKNCGNFKDGTGEHTNLLLLAITICVGSYAFINTAVWELFEREITKYFSPFIYNIMDLAVMVGIGCLGYVFNKKKKNTLKKKAFMNHLFFER